MSKNVLSNGAYSPTAATSRRASSWVLVFLEMKLVGQVGVQVLSLHPYILLLEGRKLQCL